MRRALRCAGYGVRMRAPTACMNRRCIRASTIRVPRSLCIATRDRSRCTAEIHTYVTSGRSRRTVCGRRPPHEGSRRTICAYQNRSKSKPIWIEGGSQYFFWIGGQICAFLAISNRLVQFAGSDVEKKSCGCRTAGGVLWVRAPAVLVW